MRQNVFVHNDVGFRGPDTAETAQVTLGPQHVPAERRRHPGGLPRRAPGRQLRRQNARWGIHAPGAIDLGGNTARGNGNEPQCVGVVCTAH
jgi:hypothetical protein